MRIFDQILHANDECEGFLEWMLLWWRVFFGLIICIPLLFIVGFICGVLMLKNPFMAGIECVNGMF